MGRVQAAQPLIGHKLELNQPLAYPREDGNATAFCSATPVLSTPAAMPLWDKERQGILFFLFSSLLESCISVGISWHLPYMAKSEHKYVSTKMQMASSQHGRSSFPMFPSPQPFFLWMGPHSRGHLSLPPAKRNFLADDTNVLSHCHWSWPRDRMLSAHQAGDRVDGLKMLPLCPGVLLEPDGLPPAAWAAAGPDNLPRALDQVRAISGRLQLDFPQPLFRCDLSTSP